MAPLRLVRAALPLLLLLAAPAAGSQQRARSVSPRAGELSRTRIELPAVERTVFDVRVPSADGRIVRRGEDAAGIPIDVDALRRADHELGRARRGKASVALASRLAALAPADELEVAFWLDASAEGGDAFEPGRAIAQQVRGLPREVIGDAVRAARIEALDQNRIRLAPVVGGFAELVRARGGAVVVEGLGWPLVVARVRSADVLALAADPRVDAAYLSQPEWYDENDNASGTMRTYNLHDLGVLADGSVRVFVNDTANVQTTNPYLPPIVTLVPGAIAAHATGVAGNIANFNPVWYAAAYTLPELYSAGGSGDSAAPVNWQAGLQNGIDFGNCSWWNGSKGSIVFLDRFFDYTIRNFSVMMFKSNGNQGLTLTPYSTTPGNGYNMICSGAYSDSDDVQWSDDAMASSSSYWNPISGQEKPEVAAPGTCVTTTGLAGMQSCFGGTSSASPLTLGIATLLATADNTLLSQMTTVKAALMVSAWHNVEDAPLLSDKDGAGGIHAMAAYQVVRDGQWWFDDVTDADFAGGTLDVTLPLLRGEETRVIALWLSSADSAYSTDVLDMDLDLVVLDPFGVPVASAASAVDAFELASFTADETGDFTVRLTKQRFDGVAEPLTVAWSTRNDTGTATLAYDPSSPAFAIGQDPELVVEERYTGSGKPYFAWAALQGATGLKLPGGYTMPIDYDLFSSIVITLPGFLGVLDANGQGRFTFELPDYPPLVGLTLHFGVLVLEPVPDVVVNSLAPPLELVVGP